MKEGYPWNRRGVSKVVAGALTLAVLLVGLFVAFNGVPFRSGYELKAVFADAANVGLRSPVRIAGVEVGRVTKVEAAGDDSTASLVTMELDDEALPIRSDAELKIRPRIFLEGNFFVDLEPGTPEGRQLDSGDTVPIAQTAAPVQLDQVLGALKTDARKDLQTLVQGYGKAISGEPTAAEDATQDPDVRGQTAAEAGNRSLRYAPGALRGLAVVNQALLGVEPHDLSKLIRGGARVSRELEGRESTLQDLIVNLNVTTGALASEQGNLRATVRALP
ncbi:MAG TPA: MlaD family protein, partial [Thermoleophilaceae bacterium]|nr:MlaD family protein [Thermoleophilaceae bacterium]